MCIQSSGEAFGLFLCCFACHESCFHIIADMPGKSTFLLFVTNIKATFSER